MALWTATAAIAVLVGAGFLMRERIAEEWNVYWLQHGGDPAKERAAERLGQMASVRGFQAVLDLWATTVRDTNGILLPSGRVVFFAGFEEPDTTRGLPFAPLDGIGERCLLAFLRGLHVSDRVKSRRLVLYAVDVVRRNHSLSSCIVSDLLEEIVGHSYDAVSILQGLVRQLPEDDTRREAAAKALANMPPPVPGPEDGGE